MKKLMFSLCLCASMAGSVFAADQIVVPNKKAQTENAQTVKANDRKEAEKAMYDAYAEVKDEYAAIKKQLTGLNPDEKYSDKEKYDAINSKLNALEGKVCSAGYIDEKGLTQLEIINNRYASSMISNRLVKQLKIGRILTENEKAEVNDSARDEYNRNLRNHSEDSNRRGGGKMAKIGLYSTSDSCIACQGKGQVPGKLGKCTDCNGTGKKPETPSGGCRYCYGKGKINVQGKLGPEKCSHCNGTGKAGI